MAPMAARKPGTGQFVILRIGDEGEPIPLTTAGFDCGKGTINLYLGEVGKIE
jgi:NAD(P)H-flavin reductase